MVRGSLPRTFRRKLFAPPILVVFLGVSPPRAIPLIGHLHESVASPLDVGFLSPFVATELL